jgi:hypothetical protein
MGLLFIPQIIYVSGPWWNNVGRGKLKNSGKNLSQCRFVHKSCMDCPGLHGEKPATNRLSHSMAKVASSLTSEGEYIPKYQKL